ncbi:hypothetical protein D0962_33410 [Leptolyngbyaceae cyanobacterium CCMR0082]|uniref:Uncharacterized protein n=2 Tax=Adonisia turfae TaxID=2950184 RepID=A0A6M0SHW2_9CYAN|nr:hypothetical protein [Adonisia turfae]NEZ60751.1 hypothetical protein [Adonisia turfae CCMR0081]NEZ67603.1 hypothetical protein [Adonisia turfae CCMR0082]
MIERGQNVLYGQNTTDISEHLLRGTRGFSLVNIVKQESVDFAGGYGYLLEAEMDGMTVMQCVYVPADGQYIRSLATGARGAFSNGLPAVEEIAGSVIVND